MQLHEFQHALGARPMHYYAEIGSTNDTSLAWLRDNAAHGSIVIADYQTRGRGRLGRSWHAPPGTALMFSIILRPSHLYLARVNMIAALSVEMALNDVGAAQTTLKWPNDVLLNGRKVCGILSEGAWDGSQFLGVALGIGINVSVDFGDTPMASSAISVSEVTSDVDRVLLLTRVLHHLDTWMAQIATDTPRTTWRARLSTIGQAVRIALPQETISGIAEDVDEHGALLIRRADGTLGRAFAGDIAGLSMES
ncbi:MAG: biotin--[acetyl-CoA-carboxylase] ligase [Chloroflexota bacterium]|nr:biotin--[acetyl-CoA-carboxylase] ligase [Chloroflexota bacterium]